MRKQSTLRLSGNERYEGAYPSRPPPTTWSIFVSERADRKALFFPAGFCIELIEKLAEILKFNYTFVEQLDQKYGSYKNETDSWNGMIGRLMDDKEVRGEGESP